MHSPPDGTVLSRIVERFGDGTLSKAAAILRLVASESGLSLAHIVRRAGLPKSTCRRLLLTLDRLGFVQGCAGTGGAVFVLGPLIDDLASGSANRQRLAQIARPIMERLRDRTNETVLLHCFEGGDRVVIAQIESLQQLRRTYTSLGVRVPIHGGAASKVYLASLSESELNRRWAAFPPAVTRPDRSGAFKRFAAELNRVRRQGYSITFADLTPGVASVGMGVPSADGRVHCALSVTGPLSRLSERTLKSFVPHLAAAVRELARTMTGDPRIPRDRRIPRRVNGTVDAPAPLSVPPSAKRADPGRTASHTNP